MEAIASYFKFAERGTNLTTEIRAGATTFMVMAYIIFLNPAILSAAGVDVVATAAATALIAGIMTIAMGVVGNFPIAIAAGLGINAIVAFGLVLGRGLTFQGAMGVIVLEGLLVVILVLARVARGRDAGDPQLAEAGHRRRHRPVHPVHRLRQCRSDRGRRRCAAGPLHLPDHGWSVRRAGRTDHHDRPMGAEGARSLDPEHHHHHGDCACSPGVTKIPESFTAAAAFSTIGAVNLTEAFDKLGLFVAILIIFSIALIDFFDTMGTVTAVGNQAGLCDEEGRVPNTGRILLVDSIAAVAGGLGGTSSNTSYIESSAGVGEGGRTGFTSVVTGVLFLLSILLAPLALMIPGVATAPALIIVGYLLFEQIGGIDVADPEEGIPALLAMILMPLTYDIAVGIGAGFIAWTLIKVVRGSWATSIRSCGRSRLRSWSSSCKAGSNRSWADPSHPLARMRRPGQLAGAPGVFAPVGWIPAFAGRRSNGRRPSLETPPASRSATRPRGRPGRAAPSERSRWCRTRAGAEQMASAPRPPDRLARIRR